ncbi:hypothetical protein KJ359_003141 [Pestalotiopsis sp. 9143b]|nr:hypothetical protein KJ359_003141 [Pestalotiopsis sp. 9143b]
MTWKRGSSPRSTIDQRRRNAIVVFSALAALSLATTWYHMFCFFQWSYREWETPRAAAGPLSVDRDGLYLGDWLRDTTLFKQAWVSTLETPLRAWWSTQIFGFCAIWSVMLAAQAHKRSIPHLWLFMLLGQIVAISFAANLSFLAFLVYDQDDTPPKDTRKKTPMPQSPQRSSWLPHAWVAVLCADMISALVIPDQINRPGFIYLLLAPHVLAFVPFLLGAVFAAPGAAQRSAPQPPVVVRGIVMASLLCTAFTRVFDGGGDLGQILDTLYEHPAVSSVGWDVVCCWVSFAAWHVLGAA